MELLDIKYGRTITEKVEECVEDLSRVREDQHEEDNELILAMKEINQRHKELSISQEEWFAVWMLLRMRKRYRMDNYEFQALRDIVKEGGYNVVEKL